MNPRLVFSLFIAVFAGMLAGGFALLAGWGVIAGFVLYSGVGSTTLVALALAWPDRAVRITGRLEEPALA